MKHRASPDSSQPLISFSVRKALRKHLARSAVVIGASSGIGAAVAVELARRGYTVGIAARRVDALREVASLHPGITATVRLDLHDIAASRAAASDLVTRVGGADVFIISAGTGGGNPALGTRG